MAQMEPYQEVIVNDYRIYGNEYLAIAISIRNPKDAHWFTPQEITQGFNLNALDRALAWTSPGL